MSVQAEITNKLIRDGVELLPGELRVDLSIPMALPITGINELTGETKHYMLRVTSKGSICIV